MDQLLKILSLTFPILIPGLGLIIILKLRLLSFLNTPLDLGLSINKKRIFGNNKTFRGVFVMIVMAVFVSYILNIGYKSGYDEYIHPVFSQSPILIGIIYSLSYILGELINSFTKRRLNISAGKITHTKFRGLQMFFDLTDGIIVLMIALLIFTSISVKQVLAAGFIGIFMHYCTDVFMKRLRLKH